MSEVQHIELIYVIVNDGIGTQITHFAKRFGVTGGTELMAKGTISNKILDYLGISDMRKEIVLMMAEEKVAAVVLEKLNAHFKFHKPNHGIAFTTTVCGALGNRVCRSEKIVEESGEERAMYHLITTIVEKGKAEFVIEAANKAGSKGGTIINARGSGLHETSKLFAMDIEPEKEIVLILSEKPNTEKIVTAIRSALKIDEPGNGIIYIQEVNKTFGLFS